MYAAALTDAVSRYHCPRSRRASSREAKVAAGPTNLPTVRERNMAAAGLARSPPSGRIRAPSDLASQFRMFFNQQHVCVALIPQTGEVLAQVCLRRVPGPGAGQILESRVVLHQAHTQVLILVAARRTHRTPRSGSPGSRAQKRSRRRSRSTSIGDLAPKAAGNGLPTKLEPSGSTLSSRGSPRAVADRNQIIFAACVRAQMKFDQAPLRRHVIVEEQEEWRFGCKDPSVPGGRHTLMLLIETRNG